MSLTQTAPAARRVAAAPAQTISAERAAGLVTSDMWLDYGTGLGQPDVFDRALAARICEVSNVKIRHCLTMRPRAVLDADPDGQHVHTFSLHFSGYDRKKHDEGRCHYIPVNLGEISDYYRRFMAPADVVVFKTCPVDEHGYFNLSAANLWHRAILERARTVIVETNRHLPYVYGEQTGRPHQRGGLHHRRRRLPRAGAAQSTRPRRGRRRRAAHRRGDRGRRLPAGRHRRHAQRRVRAPARKRRARPGRAHRDDDRRAGRALQGRTDHRRAQAAGSRQGGLHVRPRVAGALRHAGPQPGHALLSGGVHELAARHHAERSHRVDPEHHADRPAGTGRVRVRRPSSHQRHRRPAPVRARRLRVEGRQDVHLPVVHLRQARRAPQPDRARSDARATS